MREFTREAIIANHFGQARRGYDPIEVDEYLEDLAEYVGWQRAELARLQGNECAALELLRNAQRVADEKLMAAALGADQRRAAGEAELAAARAEAGRLLEAARCESDRIVASARSQAVTIEEESRERLAAIEQLVDQLSRFVNDSAMDLRAGGARLLEVADGFQFELTARSESLGTGGHTVDLR